MKITGSVGGGNPKKVLEAIKHFKNERYPSIAVTVDLLTTGIDVPEITTLVFMRRVKSRILFEQMLGRATRLCPKIHKTHFEIYFDVLVIQFKYNWLKSPNLIFYFLNFFIYDIICFPSKCKFYWPAILR